MSPGTALILGIWYYFNSSCWNFTLSFSGLGKPIFHGWFVGLILGDPMQGLLLGAAIQLLYIANISAGGSQAADPNFAGIIGVAVAMMSDGQVSTAIAAAIPLGLVGNLRQMFHMTINSFWTHLADREANKGSYRGIFLWQVLVPQFIHAVTAISMVYFACTLGSEAVKLLLENLPKWATDGLQTIGGMLPAVGICMALSLIFKSNTAPFFFLGWVLNQYLGYSGIVLAVIGCIISYVGTFGVKLNKGEA